MFNEKVDHLINLTLKVNPELYQAITKLVTDLPEYCKPQMMGCENFSGSYINNPDDFYTHRYSFNVYAKSFDIASEFELVLNEQETYTKEFILTSLYVQLPNSEFIKELKKMGKTTRQEVLSFSIQENDNYSLAYSISLIINSKGYSLECKETIEENEKVVKTKFRIELAKSDINKVSCKFIENSLYLSWL